MPETDLRGNQHLYPGAVVLALAILGLSFAFRGERRKRRWVVFLTTIGILSFALSLGAHLSIYGWAPLAVVHQAIPFLGYTRSAFRFAALVQLALVLLAVEGLAMLWNRNRGLALAVAALALLELAPPPERLVEVPDTQPAWAAMLAQEEQPVVVHIPWAPDRSASSYADTTRWMIESLPIEARLVNGYSGFFPSLNAQLRDLLEVFPDDRSIEALKTLGIDYVVLHGEIDLDSRDRISELANIGQITDYQTLGDQHIFWIAWVVD
jgi:hypothetical protein